MILQRRGTDETSEVSLATFYRRQCLPLTLDQPCDDLSTTVQPCGDLSTNFVPCTHPQYINANFVSGYNDAKNRFIAAQGPKTNTITHFWYIYIFALADDFVNFSGT